MLPNKINYLVRANEIKTNDQLYKIYPKFYSAFFWKRMRKNNLQFAVEWTSIKNICHFVIYMKSNEHFYYGNVKSEICLNKKEFDLWLFFFGYERTLIIVTHKWISCEKRKYKEKWAIITNK